MSHLYLFITFFSAFLLQVSVFSNLKIFGLVPNILLVIIIFLSFRRDIKKIMPYIFIFGVLLDVIFGNFFGFHLLFFFFVAWVSDIASKDAKSVSLQRVLVVTFLASFFYSIYLGYGLYAGGGVLGLKVFLFFMSQIALNLFTAFVLFGFLDRFNDFLDRIDNVSKQKVRI